MRRFSTFQALGGHMTGHTRLEVQLRQQREHGNSGGGSPAMRVTNRRATGQLWHPCSKCGQEFRMGQALGGHMRRHRAEEAAAAQASEEVQPEPETPNLNNPLVEEVGEGEVAQVPRLLNLLV
uniref:C2H2-type domain-containing protein n=1 Tax=Leersia perrieri TaxID=77586 RepID=A0A0D9WHC7_9ORYZ